MDQHHQTTIAEHLARPTKIPDPMDSQMKIAEERTKCNDDGWNVAVDRKIISEKAMMALGDDWKKAVEKKHLHMMSFILRDMQVALNKLHRCVSRIQPLYLGKDIMGGDKFMTWEKWEAYKGLAPKLHELRNLGFSERAAASGGMLTELDVSNIALYYSECQKHFDLEGHFE